MSERMNELREEASELSEAFSPALHAKVMAQVRAQASPRPERGAHPWRLVMTAAAMIAVAVGVWAFTRSAFVPPQKEQIVRDFSISNPLPRIELADTGNPTYAYLDQDAKAFGRFVVRQLEQLPAR